MIKLPQEKGPGLDEHSRTKKVAFQADRSTELGKEAEIIIARNGRPAAKRVGVTKPPMNKRPDVAKGKFHAPDDIDTDNDEIADLFAGTGSR